MTKLGETVIHHKDDPYIYYDTILLSYRVVEELYGVSLSPERDQGGEVCRA